MTSERSRPSWDPLADDAHRFAEVIVKTDALSGHEISQRATVGRDEDVLRVTGRGAGESLDDAGSVHLRDRRSPRGIGIRPGCGRQQVDCGTDANG